MNRLDLKPYSFMSLLDAAFSLYRRNFAVYFWITAAFFLVLFFAEELINLRFLGPQNFIGRMFDMIGPLTGGPTTPEDIDELQKWQQIALYTIPLSLLFFIVVPLSQGAIIHAVHLNALGSGCGFREAFRIGFAKYINLLLGFLLVNVIFAIIFSLLVFPIALMISFGNVMSAAYCAVFLLLGPPVLAALVYAVILFGLYSQSVVIENKGPAQAIVRSAKLVNGHWWRAFGIYMCIQIINSLIYSFSEVAFSSLNSIILSINPGAEIFGQATVATGLTVVQIFTTPILILGQTILFYDLKVRKEAYDLEMMIRAF